MAKKSFKTLGKNQRAWLGCVAASRRGLWYAHITCGYLWSSRSKTVALCESLARRGLLRETTYNGHRAWKPTADGYAEVERAAREREERRR